eukprot:4210356-Pleurochrysis_carterae.AAC.1
MDMYYPITLDLSALSRWFQLLHTKLVYRKASSTSTIPTILGLAPRTELGSPALEAEFLYKCRNLPGRMRLRFLVRPARRGGQRAEAHQRETSDDRSLPGHFHSLKLSIPSFAVCLL